MIGPLLVLQFISGVYFAYGDIPPWMQQVAASSLSSGWPRACGRSSTLQPWNPGGGERRRSAMVALVLILWLVAGLVLCTRTFTWFKRGSV